MIIAGMAVLRIGSTMWGAGKSPTDRKGEAKSTVRDLGSDERERDREREKESGGAGGEGVGSIRLGQGESKWALTTDRGRAETLPRGSERGRKGLANPNVLRARLNVPGSERAIFAAGRGGP